MYQIEYLPIAMQDMVDIARYISHELCNPAAAEKLSQEMVEVAEKLAAFPYSNAVHVTIRPLKLEYRKLIIRNYIMFYWVDETKKRVVIARVLFARRDYEKLI